MSPRLKKPTVEVPRDYYIALEDAANAAAELFSGFSTDAVEKLEESLEKLDGLTPDDAGDYPYAPEEERGDGGEES
jgi:hypothetical protein